MSLSKHLFEDHKDQLEWEKDALHAYQEKTQVKFKKCSHPGDGLNFIGRELRCKACGMAWSGSGEELLLLKKILTKK